ncbi:hypothetical protein A3649_16590 [Mycobacterium ulcerans]|nr:hypothetical protein A3649_16590 [Mycobacterium ulcerans]
MPSQQHENVVKTRPRKTDILDGRRVVVQHPGDFRKIQQPVGRDRDSTGADVDAHLFDARSQERRDIGNILGARHSHDNACVTGLLLELKW